jgi:hypothetical protein
MPDSSPSPAAPASYGSRDAVPAHATSGVNSPRSVSYACAEQRSTEILQHRCSTKPGNDGAEPRESLQTPT